MSDFWDWQEDGAELDALMASHGDRSFPPGVLEAYIARQRARHRAMQAEISRLLANAKGGSATAPLAEAAGGGRPPDDQP